jgi:hypothetical protein
MKSAKRIAILLTAFLWAMLFLTENAHAYLDPGTGSYFLQILMAAVLGAAFSLKMYWQRIKLMLSGNPEPENHQ